jgi:hypothetical protein
LRREKIFDQKIYWSKFLEDNYSRGNDFATIKTFRPKIFVSKFLVDNCPRGNDFVAIKIFEKEIVLSKFYWITIAEEMILRYKIFDHKFPGQNF